MRPSAVFSTLLLSFAAFAEERPKSYRAWMVEGETLCAAKPDATLAAPDRWEHKGFTYEVYGARAAVKRKGGRQGPVRIGVIGALLDDEKETVANLAEYADRFRREKVDLVVVSGGSGRVGAEIERNLARLAALDVPVLAMIGNTESRGTFNLALRDVRAKHPNVLHLGFLRAIQFDGFAVVSAPGYHDEQRLLQRGACKTRPKAWKDLKTLAKGLEGPVVLVAQDTPRQKGKAGLDYLPLGGNIGDADLARGMREAKLTFGIFSTVPEAGGRATTSKGKLVKEGAASDELLLNPGAANSLPTRLNAGGTSYGRAAVMTLADGKASWTGMKSRQRVGQVRRVRVR